MIENAYSKIMIENASKHLKNIDDTKKWINSSFEQNIKYIDKIINHGGIDLKSCEYLQAVINKLQEIIKE